jgi:hypothetical protein
MNNQIRIAKINLTSYALSLFTINFSVKLLPIQSNSIGHPGLYSLFTSPVKRFVSGFYLIAFS